MGGGRHGQCITTTAAIGKAVRTSGGPLVGVRAGIELLFLI